MQTKEWTFPRDPEYPRQPGPWDDEPDKIQWQDKATGLPCLVVRNRMGTLCGYVGVTETHPWFEKDYGHDDVDINVHGGLTFSRECKGDPEEQSICHLPEPGEPDHVWWFGFDCGHLCDVIPAMIGKGLYGEEGTYKGVQYVKAECANLAAQLAAATK